VRFDLSYTLFFVSLGISAAAVVVFLWLMRAPREANGPREALGVKREARDEEPNTPTNPD
jgi:hypothetical protein